MIKEEVIKKYVNDLDGLLKEVKEWEKKPIDDVYVDEFMYHDAVVFIFGRLFSFFNFSEIMFLSREGLDAVVGWNDEITSLEFEVFSRSFKRDHLKEIKKDEKVIVVCWKDNWKNPPDNIDVIELKHFWEITS